VIVVRSMQPPHAIPEATANHRQHESRTRTDQSFRYRSPPSSPTVSSVTIRRISRDSRGQRSSRSAIDVPERERTDRFSARAVAGSGWCVPTAERPVLACGPGRLGRGSWVRADGRALHDPLVASPGHGLALDGIRCSSRRSPCSACACTAACGQRADQAHRPARWGDQVHAHRRSGARPWGLAGPAVVALEFAIPQLEVTVLLGIAHPAMTRPCCPQWSSRFDSGAEEPPLSSG